MIFVLSVNTLPSIHSPTGRSETSVCFGDAFGEIAPVGTFCLSHTFSCKHESQSSLQINAHTNGHWVLWMCLHANFELLSVGIHHPSNKKKKPVWSRYGWNVYSFWQEKKKYHTYSIQLNAYEFRPTGGQFRWVRSWNATISLNSNRFMTIRMASL